MPEQTAIPQDLTPEDAKGMLARVRPGEVTILDVRQDWEYEEFHLPGAKLVPLSDLDERLGEIPRDKPLLVYCHSGRRSAAAASLLSGKGFPKVLNLRGGAMAWTGATAVGAPETGMHYYRGDEPPEVILALAFAMERELGAFYHGLADAASEHDLKATFMKLAGFEEKHKLVVYHLYKTLFPQNAGIEELESKATAKILEGGRDAEQILADTKGFPSPREALDMAMGVEAQAMDLYMRYASVATSPEAVAILHDLAKEERGHLQALATLMNRLGEKQA
jgi:rhodanese-related sulfurtransferase/rubrerythrin